MNEFVTFVVQRGVRLRFELRLEETVAHLARNLFDIVVVVAEAQVHRHLEAVGDDLRVVETRRVLEVEVVVGGGIIVEVVADEEDLFDGRMERVDKIAGRDQARRREQNALVVLHAVLAAFDVEVVDDVGIGDKGEVELVRRCGRSRLLSPESAG